VTDSKNCPELRPRFVQGFRASTRSPCRPSLGILMRAFRVFSQSTQGGEPNIDLTSRRFITGKAATSVMSGLEESQTYVTESEKIEYVTGSNPPTLTHCFRSDAVILQEGKAVKGRARRDSARDRHRGKARRRRGAFPGMQLQRNRRSPLKENLLICWPSQRAARTTGRPSRGRARGRHRPLAQFEDK
jgi:hypothetical protein